MKKLLLSITMVGILSGCQAGIHLNYAPSGTGLAATAHGPGYEGSVQDQNGVTVLSGGFAVNPMALVANAVSWVGHLFDRLTPTKTI